MLKSGMFFKRIGRWIVNLFFYKGSIRATSIIFIFAFGVGLLFLTLIEQPAYATALVAFGTLALAIVTAWNIDEARRREKRDREERWLKEIKDWATNVLICGLNPGERDTFESPEDIKPFKVSLFQNITAMRRLNREGMAFKYIDLSNWKGLVRKSKNLRKAIGVQVGLLDEWSKSLSDKARYEAADTHRGIMNDIAESIIEEAQNMRSNFLKSK